MGYRTLRACLNDLEATGNWCASRQEIDPRLEAAEIHRRVFQAGGPAIYFARVKGCRLSDGQQPVRHDRSRMRFIFRDTLDSVRRLIEVEGRSGRAGRQPWRNAGLLPTLWHTRPRAVGSGPVLSRARPRSTNCRSCKSWPDDGGAFITLPQVYTEDAGPPRLAALEPGHVPRAAFRRAVSAESRRSACTTRSIAASACITRPRSAAASRCG